MRKESDPQRIIQTHHASRGRHGRRIPRWGGIGRSQGSEHRQGREL